MGYREVSVIEVKEILPLWLDGRSLRDVRRVVGADRKTARRYLYISVNPKKKKKKYMRRPA